ncbi:MAG TPA: transcription-repair coupling factor, partial [Burkholderiaceae bacterium]|nr:transcription-repair coupling factor [Burkholderiaceae bacterium]
MAIDIQPPPSLSSTETLLAALKPGHRYSQPQPPGSADSWMLAELARASGRTLIVLCADPLAAQRLTEEVSLLSPGLRVRRLPDWETLPYDGFSPHEDLISERLRTLHALMQNEVDILTVPVTTALYRLAPPSFMAA